MQLFEDALLALLAALGLVTLLYALLAALPRRTKRSGGGAVLVPCGQGDAARLEAAVRSLLRARDAFGGFCRVVIVDLGMDADARAVAGLLCREAEGVTLLRGANLSQKELLL